MAQGVESVDVTQELGSWLGDDDDEYMRVVLLVAASGGDARKLLQQIHDSVQGAAGSGKTFTLLTALRNALSHESRLEDIAERAELDPDSLLDVLATELARGPLSDSNGPSFSTNELSALQGANVDLSGPPPLTSAAVTTATAYARMLAEALTVDECARLLGVTPGRVRQRVNERSLHAIRSRVRGEWRLPRWQFDDHGVVTGVEAVLFRLPESLHPLAVEYFMTTPVPDLDVNGDGLSPVQWLQSGGEPKAVVELAVGLPAAS
jgi:excisionase family DNA binding protein